MSPADPTTPVLRSGSWTSLTLVALVGGIVGLGALVMPGLTQPDHAPDRRAAQPAGDPGRRPPGTEGPPGPREGERVDQDRPPMAAADLRGRLQRRLDDVRVIQQRLEAGLASLDAGATPDDVMRDLFEPGLPRGFESGRGGPDSRGPDSRGPDGRGPDARAPMTPDERDRLLSMIRERMPRVADWIAELERDEPRLLEAVRARLAPQLREIERLAERDPQGAAIRTEELISTIGVMRATRLYRGAVSRAGADSPLATQQRAVLREALVAQFDAHLASSEHEIAALSQRIEALHADIESQTRGRDPFIDAALDRIMQDALRPAPEPGREPGPPPAGGG